VTPEVEVSVVIATRNRSALLAEAVRSVLAQTGVRWELLVVDDASTDGTWAYLEALRGPSVRGLRLEIHGERSAARNLGLAEARAPYVMFLDDDDLLRKGALQVLCGPWTSNPMPWPRWARGGTGSSTRTTAAATCTSASRAGATSSTRSCSGGRPCRART